mgnify:FL=1
MVPLLDQGGLERICAMTAKLLTPHCHLTLVVFSTKGMIYDVDGVDMIDLNLGSVPGKVGKAVNLCKRIRAIKKIKRERNIEITYSFGPTANLANVFTRVKNAKVNHEQITDKIWVGIRGYGALEDKYDMTLFCKRADKVVCCSQIMADEVKAKFWAKDVVCVYNPCDVESIRRLAKEPLPADRQTFFAEGAPVVAAMGREHDVKGFWHLIKAFALAKKKIPELKLMIVGEGTFAEYRKLAEDLQVEQDVWFTGVQKNPFAYLKRASLFVMTSVSEGFPNSLIEAMAVGLPAMSVNCKTGPAEIFLDDYRKGGDGHTVIEGEYGVLLPVIHPEKNLDASVMEKEEEIMAEQMVRVLTEPEKLAERKAASLKRAEDFSVQAYTDSLLRMI